MEDYNSKYSGEEVDGLLDEIGNKVDKVDGKQLSTEDFTTILKQKLDGLSNYDDTTISQAVDKLRKDLDALVSGDTTTAIKTFNEVIAFLDGISDTEDLSGIIASIEQQIAGKMDSVTLAKVATSGSYNDLSDKPTIPSAVTENTVSGWGFTKNTGTYSKPSTGIPKTDLASGVQTSLNKADTALQSYTEQYKGTVTGVKINGSTKNPSNGVVDLGTVITSHQDISGKQDRLVSGTNIKTINGESILGSGDISISSTPVDETDPIFTASPASSITDENITSWNNKLDKLNTYYGTSSTTAYTSTKDVTCSGYALTTGNRIAVKFSNRNTATSVYLNINGTGAKQVYFRGAPIKAGFWDDGCVLDFVYDGTFYQVVGGVTRSKITYTSSTTSIALTAGNYYYWSSVGSSVTITSISGYLNMLDPTQIVLTIGSTVPTITLPSGIKWVNGVAPVPVANSVLEISILEDRATYSIFK